MHVLLKHTIQYISQGLHVPCTLGLIWETLNCLQAQAESQFQLREYLSILHLFKNCATRSINPRDPFREFGYETKNVPQ